MQKDNKNNNNNSFVKSLIKTHSDILRNKLNIKLNKLRQNLISQSKSCQSKLKSLSISISNQFKDKSESFEQNFNSQIENRDELNAQFLEEFTLMKNNIIEQINLAQDEIISQYSTECNEIAKDFDEISNEIMTGIKSIIPLTCEEYQKNFGDYLGKFGEEIRALLNNFAKNIKLFTTTFENALLSALDSFVKDIVEIIKFGNRKNIDNDCIKIYYKSGY